VSQTHLLYGRTLRGIIAGEAEPRQFIPELVALIDAGAFPLAKLVQFFPFDRIDEALAAMRAGAVVKPVLVFDGDPP
jgi:aryl-alcohol dehydrogenase